MRSSDRKEFAADRTCKLASNWRSFLSLQLPSSHRAYLRKRSQSLAPLCHDASESGDRYQRTRTNARHSRSPFASWTHRNLLGGGKRRLTYGKSVCCLCGVYEAAHFVHLLRNHRLCCWRAGRAAMALMTLTSHAGCDATPISPN